MLTVSAHANRQALLEATLLAAVPVDPHDGATFVLQTFLVLDVLLDTATKETLQKETRQQSKLTVGLFPQIGFI